MPELPKATTTIDDQAGAFAGATGFLVVLAAVALNADITPRVFSSGKAILTQHKYSQGADFAAMHIAETGLPVIFVGLPIVTTGSVRYQNDKGVTGNSTISVSAGADGILEEVEGIVTVVTGGTVGANGIVVDVSVDNNRTKTRVRLGTANSYAIPYLGITINFGAGTLNVDDVFAFATKAPLWDSAGIAAARTALAAQQRLARAWMVIGDVPTATYAGYVRDAINAYQTSNQRDSFATVAVGDYEPKAKKTIVSKDMTGAPAITFAEVGATGDTITRATGSFIDDGFAVGDHVVVSGSASNNVTGVIASLTATVLTLNSTDLVDESAAAGAVAIKASATLTFAEVGATGDTITRSSGSWVSEGFAVGDNVAVTGTALNNVTADVAAVSATVLTLNTVDLAAEVIPSHLVTMEKTQTMEAWAAAQDTAFASISVEPLLELGLGRGRKKSPITGAIMRRPTVWGATSREFQHDLHIPAWRKSDGPLSGWDLNDENGNTAEFDERVHGGGLAGRFTCARTWGNGPNGMFMAMTLTRAQEGSLLSLKHNRMVANLACTIAQAETENAIGQVLTLNDDGTAKKESLSRIESRVNTALENNLLKDKLGEGPRASKAVWRAAVDDILNVADATLNGTLELLLNGTITRIATRVRVLTGGAS